MKNHATEVDAGNRFKFGANWQGFLSKLSEERIIEAEKSLKIMLEIDTLEGMTFLDIGSGSGLSSLAARRLGAKVSSFDYDPLSVACTSEIKRRYFNGSENWEIQEGSVLDIAFLKGLGEFDIVYSWGVLHHTGDMWQALENVDTNVKKGGYLFISLYNDQGGASKRWLKIKKIYNKLPRPLKMLFALIVFTPIEARSLLIHTVRGKPGAYFSYIKNYHSSRGMSWLHDKIDWVGGYPFEVSKPEQIFDYYREKKYTLRKLTTCAGGLGCNQFVFLKEK